MTDEYTTAVVQCCLDELAGGGPASGSRSVATRHGLQPTPPKPRSSTLAVGGQTPPVTVPGSPGSAIVGEMRIELQVR